MFGFETSLAGCILIYYFRLILFLMQVCCNIFLSSPNAVFVKITARMPNLCSFFFHWFYCFETARCVTGSFKRMLTKDGKH